MLRNLKDLFLVSWKKQTVLVITLTCILINVFGIILYFKNEKVNDGNSWIIHSYEILRSTRSLLIDLQDIEIAQREYLLTRQTNFLTSFDISMKSIATKSDTLIKQVSDNPSQIEKAKKIKEQAILQINSLRRQVIAIINNRQIFSLKDIAETSQDLENSRNVISDFMIAEKKLLDNRIARQKENNRDFVSTILFGSIFAIIALLGANGLIIYYSTRGNKAEADLKRSQEIYTTVTQGINEGVYELNVPEKTMFLSPSFKKMLGYEEDEFPNTIEAVNEHIHPEDFKHTWEIANKYFNREIPHYRNFFRMKHRDGYYLWIMSRGVGLWDKNGRIQTMVGTHTDITEQKENEEYLKRLNAEIENFTYITSHDLRSPLVNLKGFSFELQYNIDELSAIIEEAKPHLDEAKRKNVDVIFGKDMPEALNYIKSSIERLDQLTSAILDLSKIGRREIKVELVSTENIVKKCLDSLAYEIQNKNIEISTGHLPEVNSDYVSISQIFSNIIENAIKYLDPEREGKIKISGKINPGEVEFTIEDNGRGISDVDKPRVFDMFKRARNVENIRGVGMGMSYVKATVQRLGGRIWFDSELDIGTNFVFTIPNKVLKKEV